MERTLENKIRMTTRALLDELLETVEKETAGLQDDTSSRLKHATERIRAKLEVIDEFDRYGEVCDKVRKTVDDVMKEHSGTIPVPTHPDLQPNTTHPDQYVPNHDLRWPPAYMAERHTWDGIPPASQFPCEASPDTTGSKPTVWKPCTSGTCETYNVMYSNKTEGGMQ